VPEGSQIIEDAKAKLPVPLIGHVTSSYYSACLNQPIALALVEGGRERYGEIVYAATPDGERIKVEITRSVFMDPKGDKQRV
jgi:sarcosine oxidase subunit alpha